MADKKNNRNSLPEDPNEKGKSQAKRTAKTTKKTAKKSGGKRKKSKTVRITVGWKAVIAIAVIVAAIYLCYLFIPPFKSAVDKFLNAYGGSSPSASVSPSPSPAETPTGDPTASPSGTVDFPEVKESPDNPYYAAVEQKTSATAARDLVVHFMDVGQGDSILVQLPDGKNMLIDGGEKGSEKVTVPYIKSLGITVLDYVVATHSDSDHIGGLDDVIKDPDILAKTVFLPQIDTGRITTGVYRSLLEAVIAENSKVYYSREKMAIASSSENEPYSIHFLSPGETQISAINNTKKKNPSAAEKNDVSPIMLLSYQGKKIVFTGDANCPVERQVITNYENGLYGTLDLRNIDLLKAGHHGSNGDQIKHGSTSQEFLNLLTPRNVVISVGEGNTYGHPEAEVLSRIAGIGATCYRTDLNGTVKATVLADRSQNMVIRTEKTPASKTSAEMKKIAERKTSVLAAALSGRVLPVSFGGESAEHSAFPLCAGHLSAGLSALPLAAKNLSAQYSAFPLCAGEGQRALFEKKRTTAAWNFRPAAMITDKEKMTYAA